MGKTKIQNERIPICIFPKGIKAGIRCSSVQILKQGKREIKFCGNVGCVYHDPIY